jgi:hypothetical protein
MDNVIPGLYASTPEPLGFGPSLEIRAFLLQRQRGNLLVYRSEMLKRDVEEINALGGISRQYLNHHHEASPPATGSPRRSTRCFMFMRKRHHRCPRPATSPRPSPSVTT